MSTKDSAGKKPSSAPTQPKLGVVGMLRFMWRQLTSMRTALFLLMLLAVAAVPGSILPQRSVDASRVNQYLEDHPTTGPWLDRIGMFDVFSSPWFSAIYLLLVVSLVGCIVPRTIAHVKQMLAQPPGVPRRLTRMPARVSASTSATPEQVADAAQQVLKRRRMRVRKESPSGEVAAESGYIKETGNLLFHVSLVVVIVGVAVGHLFGWRGDIIVAEEESFADTIAYYDTINPGPLVDTDADLPSFTMRLDSLDVEFESDPTADQYGQPRSFTGKATTIAEPGAAPVQQDLRVNHPLDFGNATVYLLGNGYAPMITVKDTQGRIIYRKATPFLPNDNNYTSTGAVKVPGASPKQLGFYGFFLPTLAFNDTRGPHSTFPGLDDPALVLGLFEGELFPDGLPQSVYTLDTDSMQQVLNEDGTPVSMLIRPGETKELPGDRGSITLEYVPRWAGLTVRYDPGKTLTLAASMAALVGLIASFAGRRRRVFVRATEDAATGRTVVDIAGLARGDDPRLEREIRQVVLQISERLPTGEPETRTDA